MAEKRDSRTHLGRWLLPIALLALAIGGYLTLFLSGPEPVAKPAEEKVWTVSTHTVERADHRPDIVTFGEIVAAGTVDLRPAVSGEIVEVGPGLSDGAVVRQGDLLVAIDPFEYELALREQKAALAEARSKLREIQAELEAERRLAETAEEQLTLKERDFSRRQDLRKRGAGSEKAVDDAELELFAARITVTTRQQTIEAFIARTEQHQALVEQAGAGVERAERNLEDTRLLAPFDGFVAATDAAVGERVGPSHSVARLIDASRLDASFQVPTADFGRLLAAGEDGEPLIGRPVQVLWRTGGTVLSYDAVLQRQGAEIDAASGGVDLYARLINAGPDAAIRPGAFVEVRMPGRLHRDAIRLPEAAVFDGSRAYVTADGRLQERQLMVLQRDGGGYLVQGALDNGDQVVTTRFPEIAPGLKVLVR